MPEEGKTIVERISSLLLYRDTCNEFLMYQGCKKKVG